MQYVILVYAEIDIPKLSCINEMPLSILHASHHSYSICQRSELLYSKT